MSVVTHKTANTYIPAFINTAEILCIVDAYIDDDETNTSDREDVLKEVDKAISLGRLDERISLLAPDKVFYGLGEDAWKDIINGKYHVKGPLVFDMPRLESPGDPGHSGEPGFHDSMMRACEMSSKHLFFPSYIANSGLYKLIHRLACRHFKGDKNNTLISSSRVGQFLMIPQKSCSGYYYDLFIGDPTAFSTVATGSERWLTLQTLSRRFTHSITTSELIGMCARNGITWNYQSLSSEEQIATRKKYEYLGDFDELRVTRSVLFRETQTLEREAEKSWKSEIGPIVQAKIKELNAEIRKRSIALDILDANDEPISLAHISDAGGGIRIEYICPGKLYAVVVDRIFTHFAQNIAASTSKAERRRCIADCYQMLEWVHPFPDGQGRTDLILLKTLLVAYGLTPAILDEPYMSTFCSLNDWDSYLASGMEKWKVEFTSKSGKG